MTRQRTPNRRASPIVEAARSAPAGGLELLANSVRARETNASELVERAMTRIAETRDLNAVVLIRAEKAREEARAADDAIHRGEQVRPLHGLPLLVKDIEDVTGVRTTFGSMLRADAAPASGDALVPRRLRGAGAIVVGKTNVPEFAFEGYTANRLFGATLNPWDRAWSPGGSSGGSAAALAAGVVPLATATDGGGSIRIPAALCGLVGLKPTHGVIARDPIPTWMDLSTDGPLATSIADIRLLLALESGPTPGDPSAAAGRWAAQADPPPAPGRLLVTERLVEGPALEPGVARLFREAVSLLEGELGLAIEWLPAGIFRSGNADADWFTIAATESAHELGRSTVERGLAEGLFEAGFARWMSAALEIELDAYVAARRRRFDYVRELDDLLGEDAVLVAPTLTVPGWTPEGVVPGRESEAPGLPLDVLNTSAINLSGHPAISVPAGRHPDGPPFGLQLVGPRHREDLLISLAAAIEAIRPWASVADGYEPFSG
jgi:Asp-tRNA(Asn)/Glu-tRNA(Gln) amidotransferase A subunit family amidase